MTDIIEELAESFTHNGVEFRYMKLTDWVEYAKLMPVDDDSFPYHHRVMAWAYTLEGAIAGLRYCGKLSSLPDGMSPDEVMETWTRCRQDPKVGGDTTGD